MKRSLVTPAARRRKAILELECPECSEAVRIAHDELVEGAAVSCRHCGAEAELTEEYDDFEGRMHWVLVDPLAEDDDEERRA